MDDLAARGVRFSAAYTPNPVCVPAREAVVTGRWGHRYSCLENGGAGEPHGGAVLADGVRRTRAVGGRASAAVPTFPRLLHESGYATFAAGKQHFRPVRDHRGYGRMELSEGQPAFRQDDEYLLFLRDRGYGYLTQPGGPRGPDYYVPHESVLPDDLHITAWNAQCCAAFIRANHNRPFFCTAGFFKPHPPFDPPRSYWDRYPAESVTLPHVGPADTAPDAPLDNFLLSQNRGKNIDAPDEARTRSVRSAYYALVEQIDDGIALMLDTLRASGILDNTVVVVSADHGELLGDHRAWGKRSFYEGSACVPMLISWPVGLPSGVVRYAPISTLDLFPTFLSAAGVSVPEAPDFLDGLDLLPYARDGVLPDRPGVVSEYGQARRFKLMWRWHEPGLNGQARAQARAWKYVWLANGGREQLFDLTADPHELHNLAGSDSARCQQAHAHLADWCRATDFASALAPDGRLLSMPFEPIPLGEVNKQAPSWPARDPDFRPDGARPR